MPGLLAGLDALLVAAVLLAAMFAVSAVFRPLLVNVLSQAPFIGGWLAGNVDSGLANFQSSISGPANASLYLLSSSLEWLSQQGRGLTRGLTDLFNAALWTSWVIATVTIPDAAGKTLRQAEALVADARGYTLGLFQQAEHDLTTSFGLAEAAATAAVSVLRSDLESEISLAESAALREVRRAEQAAGQLFQQAEYDAGQAVALAESRGVALVNQVETTLNRAVGTIERDLKLVEEQALAQLPEALRTLERDLNAVRERAEARGPELQRNLSAQIKAVIDSGPWQTLVAAYAGGEAALQANVEALVRAALVQIRHELADATTLRLKYGPQIRAALALLESGR